MDLQDLRTGMDENHFWLAGKRSLIEFLMQQACGQRRGLNILNIGAGTGEDFEILTHFGKLTVIDINPDTVALMPDYAIEAKLVADACAMPFEENSFDVIVAFDVLEHIPDDKKAVQEIVRCLKPAGTFVFTVPAFAWLFSEHDYLLGHVRRYNKPMLKRLFQDGEIKFLSFWFFSLFIPAALVRLMQNNRALEKKCPRLWSCDAKTTRVHC
jgi:ubiquinone/menaquinone biosynthesis C-methylase UbiE